LLGSPIVGVPVHRSTVKNRSRYSLSVGLSGGRVPRHRQVARGRVHGDRQLLAQLSSQRAHCVLTAVEVPSRQTEPAVAVTGASPAHQQDVLILDQDSPNGHRQTKRVVRHRTSVDHGAECGRPLPVPRRPSECLFERIEHDYAA
jgi:hypothetical protein